MTLFPTLFLLFLLAVKILFLLILRISTHFTNLITDLIVVVQ